MRKDVVEMVVVEMDEGEVREKVNGFGEEISDVFVVEIDFSNNQSVWVGRGWGIEDVSVVVD